MIAGWEGAAIGVAGVLAAAGLLYALVRAYGRGRERSGASEAKSDAITEAAKRHEKVDEILAEPVPLADDLRARMRARLERASRWLRDRNGR